MPHVILSEPFDMAAWASGFTSIEENTADWRIKIDDIYVEQGGKRVILPAVVVEEGHTQTFYIKLSKKGGQDKVTVRLDPLTDPVKTRGVKRAIGLLSETLMRYQSFVVDKNNIEGFFDPNVAETSR